LFAYPFVIRYSVLANIITDKTLIAYLMLSIQFIGLGYINQVNFFVWTNFLGFYYKKLIESTGWNNCLWAFVPEMALLQTLTAD